MNVAARQQFSVILNNVLIRVFPIFTFSFFPATLVDNKCTSHWAWQQTWFSYHLVYIVSLPLHPAPGTGLSRENSVERVWGTEAEPLCS